MTNDSYLGPHRKLPYVTKPNLLPTANNFILGSMALSSFYAQSPNLLRKSKWFLTPSVLAYSPILSF